VLFRLIATLLVVFWFTISSSAIAILRTQQTSPSATSETKSQTVYITRTGKKYHRDGCRYLHSRIPISLKEAKARGYEPCKVCNPPR